MSKMRALKTEEEIAAIPVSEPVLVELPGSIQETTDGNDPGYSPGIEQDDVSKRLQSDYEALKRQAEEANSRAERLAREYETARRLAEEREAENARLRESRVSDEDALIANGLAAAEAERDAAKLAYKQAFEAGDADGMANAQERIGRAAAKIVQYEAGAADLAERKERMKREPAAPRSQIAPDFVTAVNSNPNLLQVEREWMIRNQNAFNDPEFNKRLDFAYQSAVAQPHLVRGTREFMDFIEIKSGLKKPDTRTDNDQEQGVVSAPPSRNERGSDGRVSGSRIVLTPEERELARNLGVTDTEYARQKVAFEAARRADPDKYR